MPRMQIRLTSEQADRLRARARQRRISTAAVVREAVDAALSVDTSAPAPRWTATTPGSVSSYCPADRTASRSRTQDTTAS